MMKRMIKLTAVAGVLFLATTAQARDGYQNTLNAALGNGAAVYCGACHLGATNSGTAVLAMAGTWRSGANLALSDSDGDGFNNAQEVSGVSTNFNYNTISPFTLAKAAEGSASIQVVVVGGGQVNETVITDVYAQAGITIPAGHTIAGTVSPLVNTFPATIFFNQAVNVGDKVYAVDLVAKSSTLVSTVSFNANGSVTVSGLTGPANILIDRVAPTVPAPTGGRGGEGEENEGFEGCVTSAVTTPLMMVLAMLSLGFFVRRRKD